MKTYKVTYSNSNFRTVSKGVKAESPEQAAELIKRYEANFRVEDAKATEISEAEYLEFPTEAYQEENIRF